MSSQRGWVVPATRGAERRTLPCAREGNSIGPLLCRRPPGTVGPFAADRVQ